MSLRLNDNNLKYKFSIPAKSQNIGFQGLNRYLAKHFIEEGKCKVTGVYKTAEELTLDVIKNKPKSRRFVGNLPPEWIDKLPKENRKAHVQQIQDLFAGLAEQLYKPQVKSGYYFDFADFAGAFKKILGVDVTVDRLPAGDVGKAYKLTLPDNQYVFKVFHSDMREKYKKVHGKIFEPSRAPYANKIGRGSFADFYFGKIATSEDKDGFMLTKLEKYGEHLAPHEKIKRLVKILKSPVTSPDIEIGATIFNDNNMIGIKIIDFGNLVLLPQMLHEKLNKTAQNIGRYYFNSKKSPENKEKILKEINDTGKLLMHKSTVMDYDINLNLSCLMQRLKELIQIST